MRTQRAPHRHVAASAGDVRRSDDTMRELGWFALGAVSIAILLLALVVPDELALAFAAIGFAGLVVFRLTAAWVGWVADAPESTAAGYSQGRK